MGPVKMFLLLPLSRWGQAFCKAERIAAGAAKEFNWIVRSCFCALIRGLRTSGLRGRFKALSEAILQSFPAARAETGFAHKTPAKRL